MNSESALDIAGYDTFVRTYVSTGQTTQTVIAQITQPDGLYLLKHQNDAAGSSVVLVDTSGQTLVSFNISDIVARYSDYTEDKTILSQQEATFIIESDKAQMSIVVQNANVTLSDTQAQCYADLYILISIKS